MPHFSEEPYHANTNPAKILHFQCFDHYSIVQQYQLDEIGEIYTINLLNLHCVSKNETDHDVTYFNFNAHQPIMVIFDRDIAE